MKSAWSGRLLCIIVGVVGSQCAKLPSWRGPDVFFEGSLPSIRIHFGFASSDEGRIYAFGGMNLTGWCFSE
jgi:hypothetical protein